MVCLQWAAHLKTLQEKSLRDESDTNLHIHRWKDGILTIHISRMNINDIIN